MAKTKKTSRKKAKSPNKKKKTEEFDFNSVSETPLKENKPMGPAKTGKLQKEIAEEMEKFDRGLL